MYPTSADLAAFRSRIAYQHWTLPHVMDNRYADRAWAWEIADGIGYRDVRTYWPVVPGRIGYAPDDPRRLQGWPTLCRREAAAMRSRAYEAIRADALGDAGLADDLHAAIGTFVPEPMDPAFGPAFDEAYRR